MDTSTSTGHTEADTPLSLPTVRPRCGTRLRPSPGGMNVCRQSAAPTTPRTNLPPRCADGMRLAPRGHAALPDTGGGPLLPKCLQDGVVFIDDEREAVRILLGATDAIGVPDDAERPRKVFLADNILFSL